MEYKPIKTSYTPSKVEKRRNLQKFTTTCIICGKEFETYNKGGRWVKNTCSEECRAIKIRTNEAKYKQRRRDEQNVGTV